jgi:ferrous iron transport protein A
LSNIKEDGKKMTVATLKEGDRARIVRVTGDEAVKRHLGALGFVAGIVLRVVRTSYGNMILAVHESRIAVDGATARNIEVVSV